MRLDIDTVKDVALLRQGRFSTGSTEPLRICPFGHIDWKRSIEGGDGSLSRREGREKREKKKARCVEATGL
jgi:hypothetical protein